jgi:hypothetical protein
MCDPPWDEPLDPRLRGDRPCRLSPATEIRGHSERLSHVFELRAVGLRRRWPRRPLTARSMDQDANLGAEDRKGAFERRRSPLSQRPRARVIFVLVPVSSMNTSRCGSVCILGCRSAFHASRAWRTSGRSHSLA